MPGVAMDGFGTGAEVRSDLGLSIISGKSNGITSINGAGKMPSSFPLALDGRSASPLGDLPPELAHITLGFFPLAHLISRVSQHSWNELSDLLNDLGNTQTPQIGRPTSTTSIKGIIGGKGRGEQSSDYSWKKLQLLEFFQSKRTDFIKLLVLSQWSRQAGEVSRLIDIQAFIRMRSEAYGASLLRIGNMKQNLVGAQLATPDLTTALHVLKYGEAEATPLFGFISPGRISSGRSLKLLRKINKLLNLRLTFGENLPNEFREYVIHDGRVTFAVPEEFEIDLSIASEQISAQFFFVDMRFLFAPTTFPTGTLRAVVDQKINATLLSAGLAGCYSLLHNFVLTHKITVLFKQAVELTRSVWAEHIRVELLHRTLIIQYWCKKTGSKSWIEIAIRSGSSSPDKTRRTLSSYLNIRWIRDSEEVSSSEVDFNLSLLNVESILLSVISLHITRILRMTFDGLHKKPLYKGGELSLSLTSSSTEPGDCSLRVQLTKASYLTIILEPVSGDIVFRVIPSPLTRIDTEVLIDRPTVNDIVERVSRLRCATVLGEIEYHAAAFGWIPLNLRRVSPDSLKRTFPPSTLRSLQLFRAESWDPSWLLGFTSDVEGDKWWTVRLRSPSTTALACSGHPVEISGVEPITGWFTSWPGCFHPPQFSTLANALLGIIVMQSNSEYLGWLATIPFFPPSTGLLLQPSHRVPNIYIFVPCGTLLCRLHSTSRDQRIKQPFLDEKFRISYKGIDQLSGLATTVVHGRLLTNDNLGSLYSKLNKNIAFQQNQQTFSLVFSTPVGSSIISPLIERLQQLDNLIFVSKLIETKGFRILSLSPSRIGFSYTSHGELRGTIKFSYNSRIATSLMPPSADILPTVQPYMSMDFNQRNPHRRIKEPLSAILNFYKDGISLALELLEMTLPLLSALEQVCAEVQKQNEASIQPQFTAHGAKLFQLRYPSIRFRFTFVASRRKSHVVWLLQNSTLAPEKLKHHALEQALEDQIYNSRGDGWRGLDQGAIANTANPGNLVLEINRVVISHIAQLQTPHDRITNPIADANSLSRRSTYKDDGVDRPKIDSLNGHADNTTRGPTNTPSATSQEIRGTVSNLDVISID